VLGNDELEDGVAEEFKPLIVELFSLPFMRHARVSERFGQESWVPKLITDSFFERMSHGVDSLGRAARLFLVNFDRGNKIDPTLQDRIMQSGRLRSTLRLPLLGRLR